MTATKITRTLAALLLGLLALAAPATAIAEVKEEVVNDIKKFLPYRQYRPLPGKAIGVLVAETLPVLQTEGRSSAADTLCFSYDGLSYRWVYVPALGDKAQITNLRVPTLKGTHVYAALNMARLETVRPYGVKLPFTLVEVEVNQGFGSPKNDSFVATGFRVLDGTKRYPFRVNDMVESVRKNYADWIASQSAEIERRMQQARKKAIGDSQPNSKRKQSQLIYVTWMTQDETLHVRFVTKLSEGKFRYVQGGPAIRPFPLPPNPKRFPPPPAAAPRPQPQPPRAVPPRDPQRPGGVRPPPPGRFKVGVEYQLEFGRGYVVSKQGKIVATTRLEYRTSQRQYRAPFLQRPIDPLPPLPRPKPND